MRKIFIFFLLSIALETPSQTKRAFVVGIGHQEDPSWKKINGDKDVSLILEMLLSVGYSKNNIITLVNEQATKKTIISKFEDLIKVCRLNDIVYIHFSGHGQRVSDIDGDEYDGWDESWIPYDAYKQACDRDNGEKHLIDDEIYNILLRIRNKIGPIGKILVVVDACFSGDSACNIEQTTIDNKEIDMDDWTIRGVSDTFVRLGTKSYVRMSKKEHWLTLSACKSYQYNQEMKNPRFGILTYALYTLAKRGSISLSLIEDFVQKNKGPLPQSPMLTGETDKYGISDVLK